MVAGDIGLGCSRGTAQRAYRKGAELRIAAALGCSGKACVRGRGWGGGVGSLIRIGDVLCDVGQKIYRVERCRCLVMETMEDSQAVPGRRIVDIEVGVAKDMLVCCHVDPTMPL